MGVCSSVDSKIERFAVSKEVAAKAEANLLRGADGYIRKDTGSWLDLFRRTVSYYSRSEWNKDAGRYGRHYSLNRGSVIDFLNAQNPDAKYDKGLGGFIGGTDCKTLEVALEEVMGQIRAKEDQKVQEQRRKDQEAQKVYEADREAQHERESREAATWAKIQKIAAAINEAESKRKEETQARKKAERDKGFRLPDGRLVRDLSNDKSQPCTNGATKKVKHAETECGRVVRMTGRGERAVRHMTQEVSIFGKIADCPGVVKYLGTREAQTKNGQPKKYLYLEEYQGDLHTFGLQKLYALPLEQKRKIALLLLRALVAMHERGISHNDIKFQNILIRVQDDNIEVVFCDFDIASSDENADKCGGTSIWFSPEKFAARQNMGLRSSFPVIRKPADVWAVGLVFRTLFVDGKEPDSVALLNQKGERAALRLMDERAARRQQEGSFYPEPEEKDSIEHIIWGMLQYDYTKRLTAQQALERVKALS